MLFGGHVSIAGGLNKALERGESIGAEVIQIFVSSPHSFKLNNYSDNDIDTFVRLYKQKGFKGLFIHAVYLINLASEKEYLVKLSEESLIHYLNIGDKLGSVGTIVHLGSLGKGREVITSDPKYKQVIESIKRILKSTPSSQKCIIENNAGGGGRIGAGLEELIYFHENIQSERLGFCIDTQHLFATGVNVGDKDLFGKWIMGFDKNIGINNLTCVHLNDSKTKLGSKIDRHENIGMGNIGEQGFKNTLSQSLLKDIPFILEVPGFDKKGPDKMNLDIIRKLAKSS